MGELINKLIANSQSNMYPFHMPGHKRVVSESAIPYGLDITEVEGFDDLHCPEGIIAELVERWKTIYSAEEAFLLVNGSTAGILMAISATVAVGDSVIVARNSHKSVYNAIYIRNCKAKYIYPESDKTTGIALEIEASEVERLLMENAECKAVLITSPTYEGVISDVAAIAEVCHRHGAILIVDAAHGAHLGLTEGFPDNPLACGADIVIMSLHKTLPALTQCAILCTKGNRVDITKIRRFFDIYVTSSPSYLMMASMDECADIILQQGKELLARYKDRLKTFRNNCQRLSKIYLFDCNNYDFGKLVICTDKTNMSGSELADILRKRYAIETEMSSLKYVIAMTSFEDNEEAFNRLYNALYEIDSEVTGERESICLGELCVANKAMEVADAYDASCESVNLISAIGRIAADYIYIYPPGIPWVAPGEIISEEIINKAQNYSARGFYVRGIDNDMVRVVK